MGGAIRGGDGQADGEVVFAPVFDFHIGGDRYAVVLVVMLAKVDVGETGGAVAFEADVFPDADGGKLRTPIPAPMAGGLAEVGAAGDGPAPADEGKLGLFVGDETDGGTEVEVENVPGRAEEVGHVPLPTAEHVVCVAEQFAVEGDIGEGVEAFADQEGFFFGECGGVEGGLVFPVGFGDPLHVFFVVGDERVGDFAEGEEVGVNAAGDGRGEPVRGGILAKLPGSSEGLGLHKGSFKGGG